MLLSPSDFRDIVSGRRRGAVGWLLRLAFSLLEIPYTAVVQIRNRRFDLNGTAIHRVGVPVICVGNLTMGGTGKTPMVQYLANWFLDCDVRVAIVSRGYRAATGQQNDEAKELSEKLPSVPHVQHADRVAAATLAVSELGIQLVLLDDGFQHRRLARDLDIILIDALEPFGFEHVFPRGMLREPIAGLKRAHVVALTRADLVSDEQRDEIRRRVAKQAPHANWIELAHAPTVLQGRGEKTTQLVELNGTHVLAFCGLGNPAGFRSTLVSCGAEIVGFREFPDHHDYSSDDIEELSGWVKEHQPDMVVCTHKDFVKIAIDQLAGVQLRALIVELKVMAGEEELHDSLHRVLARVSESTSR